jgi:hypothetical protein
MTWEECSFLQPSSSSLSCYTSISVQPGAGFLGGSLV